LLPSLQSFQQQRRLVLRWIILSWERHTREAEKDISQKKSALDLEKKSNSLEKAKKTQKVKDKVQKKRGKKSEDN